MMNTYQIFHTRPGSSVKLSTNVVVTSAAQLNAAIAMLAVDGHTIIGVEMVNCRGCGEHWPCSVENARGQYSGIEHAKHGPALT